MAENESWENKRADVWRRIVELESAVSNLTTAIANVKSLAESKVSADEKTANDAAKSALAGLEKIKDAASNVEGLSESIGQLQITLPKSLAEAAQLSADCKQGSGDRQKIAELLNQSQREQTALSDMRNNAKVVADEISAKSQVVVQQCQTIVEQKTQASSNVAEIKDIHDKAVSLGGEINECVRTFNDAINTAKNDLQSLQDEKRSALDALIAEKTENLASLYNLNAKSLQELAETKTKSLKEQQVAQGKEHSEQIARQKVDFENLTNEINKTYSELKDRIESLLPGATSAGLASAFMMRKDTIEKSKGWWIVGAILSSITLIAFGVCSLFGWMPTQGLILSVAGRSVIIVGLIFIEEFCRRNYNVATRLSEAYAYKEVLATSYLGYKEQMEKIPMPHTGGDHEPDMGHSVLMQTLLEKLKEDPGKDVFDKECQIIGLQGFLDSAFRGDKDDNIGKESQGSINAQFGASKLATKVTWPVVVFSGIVISAVCIILGMLLKAGCIDNVDIVQPTIVEKNSSQD